VKTVTTLAAEPCVLHATTDGDTLTVYRSVLVHDDSELFIPVRDHLDRRRHTIEREVKVIDDNMMFGEGLLSVYRFTD